MLPLILSIDGMSCGHCLNAVNQALSAMEGVSLGSVRIGRAELNYDAGKLTPDQIAAAVTEAGYPARPVSA
jgi:copper chaperone CopZ